MQNVGNPAYSKKRIQRDRKVYTEGMKIKCGNGQEAKQILNESIWLFADAQLKQGNFKNSIHRLPAVWQNCIFMQHYKILRCDLLLTVKKISSCKIC